MHDAKTALSALTLCVCTLILAGCTRRLLQGVTPQYSGREITKAAVIGDTLYAEAKMRRDGRAFTTLGKDAQSWVAIPLHLENLPSGGPIPQSPLPQDPPNGGPLPEELQRADMQLSIESSRSGPNDVLPAEYQYSEERVLLINNGNSFLIVEYSPATKRADRVARFPFPAIQRTDWLGIPLAVLALPVTAVVDAITGIAVGVSLLVDGPLKVTGI